MGMKILVLSLILTSLYCHSRPISYSEGFTLMSLSDNYKDSIYFHYSPSFKYSVGVEVLKDDYFNDEFSYFRFTYLLNRKNTQRSQRNFYFQSGANPDDTDQHFFGLHGDWETRRWFVGFGYKEVFNDTQDFTEKYLQLGLAPYLGKYGDLHTWLMIKTKKNSLGNGWSTLPVIKFFKGDFLIELGYNTKTRTDAHIMYRF